MVAVFERRIGRPAHVIEIVGRGDYLGLGCLEQHRESARAVVESVVSLVPRTEVASLADHDPKLRLKQDEAIARDFEQGKVLANDRGRSAPLASVAAFLIAVSRQNALEGRDATIIADSLKCGIVTTLLDLDIETLARALLALHRRGLVEQCPAAGLRLKHIDALERLAGGDLQVMEEAFDGLPPEALIRPLLGIAREVAPGSEGLHPGSWEGELRETAWLVSVVGSLSVISVGLAIMIAIAVL